jgi:hypothetical protein
MTFSFFVYCRSFLIFTKNKSESRQPNVLKTTAVGRSLLQGVFNAFVLCNFCEIIKNWSH